MYFDVELVEAEAAEFKGGDVERLVEHGGDGYLLGRYGGSEAGSFFELDFERKDIGLHEVLLAEAGWTLKEFQQRGKSAS